MLREEYLLILIVVYSLRKEKLLKPVGTNDIFKAISNIQVNSNFLSIFEKTQPFTEDNIVSILLYLEERGYVKGQWLPGAGTILEGFIKITAKGIDYIENPLDAFVKEYPRSINISNIMNLNAGRDLNIIEAALIQKNTQKFTDSELKGLNEKLEEIKKIISDTSQKEIFEEIHKDLKNNDRVSAAQKLSKFQYFVAKIKDAGALIKITLLIYKIIGKIFNLPDVGL